MTADRLYLAAALASVAIGIALFLASAPFA
jgi:hypothetical protein